MKLIIDIDNEVYKGLVTEGHIFVKHIFDAIKNGTPIPDNATNGNSVMKIFSKGIVRISSRKNVSVEFNKNWWNSPYQKGGTNRKNCEYRHENGNCLKVGGFCMSVDDEHCVKGGTNEK